MKLLTEVLANFLNVLSSSVVSSPHHLRPSTGKKSKGKKGKNKGVTIDPTAIPCTRHITALLALLMCINRDKLLAANFGALPLLQQLSTAPDLRIRCSSNQAMGLIALMKEVRDMQDADLVP